MNQFLGESQGVKAAILPVDANTAAITGERISVAKGESVSIIVQMGDSTGAVVDFTLKQHDAASAGNSQNLSIANKYYKKAGAATVFTQVEPSVAAANYVLSSDFAAQEGIVIFEVNSDQLDTNNGYSYVSIDMADSTAAKIVSATYIVNGCRNEPAYNVAL